MNLRYTVTKPALEDDPNYVIVFTEQSDKGETKRSVLIDISGDAMRLDASAVGQDRIGNISKLEPGYHDERISITSITKSEFTLIWTLASHAPNVLEKYSPKPDLE